MQWASQMIANVFFVAFAIGGVSTIFYGLVELLRGWRSLSWPEVEATVVESRTDEQHGRAGRVMFTPMVRYRYCYAGSEYEGKRLLFSGLSLSVRSRAKVERFLRPFECGARIAVRVSPANPRLSVVGPGVDVGAWGCLLVGLILTIMGVGSILGMLK